MSDKEAISVAEAAHLTPVASPLSAVKTCPFVPIDNVCGFPLPSPIIICPFVDISIEVIAEAPLPISIPFAVNEVAPVPPYGTPIVVPSHVPDDIVPTPSIFG